jgi:hypothetical protein
MSVNFCPLIVVELFGMPLNETGDTVVLNVGPPANFFLIKNSRITEVHVTEPSTPNWLDAEVRGDSKWRRENVSEPMPISLLMRVTQPKQSLVRITLYPRERALAPLTDPNTPFWEKILPLFDNDPGSDGGDTNALKACGDSGSSAFWMYELTHRSLVRTTSMPGIQLKFTILPNSRRPLLYTIPAYPSLKYPCIQSFYRYHDLEMFTEHQGVEFSSDILRPDKALQMRAAPDTVLELPFNMLPRDRIVKAIAFDEISGRFMYSVPWKTEVTIVDITKTERKQQPGKLISRYYPRRILKLSQ